MNAKWFETKIEHCRSDWVPKSSRFRAFDTTSFLNNTMLSVHSTSWYDQYATYQSTIIKYVTHNMPCLSHNKTWKRLIINRAQYNKVKSQHDITKMISPWKVMKVGFWNEQDLCPGPITAFVSRGNKHI